MERESKPTTLSSKRSSADPSTYTPSYSSGQWLAKATFTSSQTKGKMKYCEVFCCLLTPAVFKVRIFFVIVSDQLADFRGIFLQIFGTTLLRN